ncbi:MAG: prepilin-type N-terminal cleavage/methylation domain-containing protein [Clostridiales bacterium]|nr:prepilin-type N-terminal cleavage/methylation domain-containing protein [Clostridiales bacterium]
MNKKNSRRASKGFTLAELLVVIAIIGVLVAISVPIFTAQLGKAKLAANQANARSAYAAAVAEYLGDETAAGKQTTYTYDVGTGKATKEESATAASLTLLPISEWKTNTPSITATPGSKKLGDNVATSWKVTISTTGSLEGFIVTIP